MTQNRSEKGLSGIEGKVVAITGASSGIGAATARTLASSGAIVVLGARRSERLTELVDELNAAGGHAIGLQTDVTRADDLVALVRAATDQTGRLDVLVSNAGVARVAPVADLDVEAWNAMIDTNLRGVLNGVAAALPVFRAQGRGHLVTVVSTSGLKIVPNQAVYAATKNAVRTFLEALRQESTDGVLRTTSISPGYVVTELNDWIPDPELRARAQESMRSIGIPADAVARAIAFAIAQPDSVEIGDITIRPTVQG
ncbi:oxidoreductase [Reticulibacter mediterranei]|uniref:Oxidoreductase n=2 Tax=Reticulibacter mediterranei TaxID=2778369 RepID=A0A8J3IIG4_9CHLR|nr:oxidoreductase [Reticulibacter mediterranei]